MHMLDWNAYRRQLVAAVGNFAKLGPETVRGYTALGAAGAKTGHLDAETRELIGAAETGVCKRRSCCAAGYRSKT
jgi:hypothetical protein